MNEPSSSEQSEIHFTDRISIEGVLDLLDNDGEKKGKEEEGKTEDLGCEAQVPIVKSKKSPSGKKKGIRSQEEEVLYKLSSKTIVKNGKGKRAQRNPRRVSGLKTGVRPSTKRLLARPYHRKNKAEFHGSAVANGNFGSQDKAATRERLSQQESGEEAAGGSGISGSHRERTTTSFDALLALIEVFNLQLRLGT